MNKPQYDGNSIVNLMSTITQRFGKNHSYPELESLRSDDLEEYDNVILLVLDGLGWNWLKHRKESFLYDKMTSKMTSTFPPTTACANMTFFAGYPSQQTGLINWFFNAKETGSMIEILPFRSRHSKTPNSLKDDGFDVEDFITVESLYEGFETDVFHVGDGPIITSEISSYFLQDSTTIASGGYEDVLEDVEKIENGKSDSYIHAYIPTLDMKGHEFGVESEEFEEAFESIDALLEDLSESLGENTKMIVTSDHGMIDVPEEKRINLEDLDVKQHLATIPGGIGRVRDFFVRPGHTDAFEEKIEEEIGDKCHVFKGEELIEDNIYGHGDEAKTLRERVGDYVVIMKENWFLKDYLPSESRDDPHIGVHGGLSEKELYVPLIEIG